MKHRLFIAVPIPNEIKNNIINSITIPENYKLTKSINLHITIQFLGDVEENRIIDITNNLSKAISLIHPFNIEISCLGQFPGKGYPKIIYLSGEKGSKKLIELANNIIKGLKKIGFYPDKKFNYHITIARMKYKKKEEINLPIFNKSITFEINKVILYESELTPNGSIYTSLWTGELI